jgi:putative membrane protein
MKPFLIRWLVTTVAVAVAAQLSGVHCDGWGPLVLASLLLGLANAFVRPVLLLLSLPFIMVTLGLFILVVNGLLFWLVGSGIVPGFRVDGFWSAFFGALIVSIVSWALSAFFRGSDGQVYTIAHHTQMKEARGRTIE